MPRIKTHEVDSIEPTLPAGVLDEIIESLLEHRQLHEYVVERINHDWADQLGKMTTGQRDEFICQQQLLYYKDVLSLAALRL